MFGYVDILLSITVLHAKLSEISHSCEFQADLRLFIFLAPRKNVKKKEPKKLTMADDPAFFGFMVNNTHQ